MAFVHECVSLKYCNMLLYVYVLLKCLRWFKLTFGFDFLKKPPKHKQKSNVIVKLSKNPNVFSV